MPAEPARRPVFPDPAAALSRVRGRDVRLLSPRQVDALHRRGLTYTAVGATRAGPPPGFRRQVASRVLPHRDLDGAAEALMSWRVQRSTGLPVAASTRTAVPGSLVLLGPALPIGPVVACRVVYTVDEPDRRGFAYGTLKGHPVSGEELFLLERDGTGRIRFTVAAFSRPANAAARVLGPLTRVGQRLIAHRYLRALDAPRCAGPSA